VDLFDFGDDEPIASGPPPLMTAPPTTKSALQPPTAAPLTADDDDFDDFQSAAPATTAPAAPTPTIPKPNYSSFSMATSTGTPGSATQFAQPSPQPGTQKADFSNLFATRSPAGSSAFSPPAQQQQQQGSGYQPTGPNYFTSVPIANAASPSIATPGSSIASPKIGAQPVKKAAGGDAFAGLLAGSGLKKNTAPAKGMTIADMAKQKSQAGLYGANAPAAGNPAPANGSAKPSGGSAMDDLLG
jgi:epsin